VKDDPRLLIGLMCGTSGDGVAGALIRTHGYGRQRQVDVLAHSITPYPADLRARLFALFLPARFDGRELGAVHREIGVVLADAAVALLDAGRIDADALTAVSVQAPTLLHEPPSGGRTGVHLEVGDVAAIAARLRTTVICDLRPSDIAVGGHGAPLSAFADYALYADDTMSRAVQNIGGIANVTYLPRGGTLEDVVAFDTGPGNMVIDEAMRRLTGGDEEFDRDGRRAARGTVRSDLLAWMQGHPYVGLPLPKTSGREDFGSGYVTEVFAWAQAHDIARDDLVATVTAFTAECIAAHYYRELIPLAGVDEMILYGGGAHNRTLVRFIEERLPGLAIRRQEEFGIPGDARESVTWALLADETLAGHAANVPAASGASRPVMLGRILRLDPPRLP
jgi:anhydro-N-acetylmuramic acid kinase